MRAAIKVNEEMLRFYWALGKGVSLMSNKYGYGSNFYKFVSEDLKTFFPDIKSFSPTNLKYMRYFYEQYYNLENRPQVGDDLNQCSNRPQAEDDFELIFKIPWGHNKVIIDKCKDNADKSLFYVRKTLENNWSKKRIEGCFD